MTFTDSSAQPNVLARRSAKRAKQLLLPGLLGLTLAISGITTAQAQETLRAGGTPSGIPFTFLDVQTNEITGAMVDVINAVGEDMGYEVTVQESPFNALIPSLTSGKIDIISAAMLKTPKRAEVVAFSDDIYPYGEGVIIKDDFSGDITNLEDLEGQVIGAQVGTTYVRQLEETGLFPEIRNYDTLADMMRDVSLGRIVAGVGDAPIMSYQLNQGRFSDLKLAEDYDQQMVGHIGLAVAQDNTELLDQVNASLAKLKGDGTLDAIFDEWGL
ncbi:amino acid ABC transporter substrate-binding protein [Billgrantia diversa]|uniref:ABC transporter substrate-binding protein n=1 Tax=Halomonas sp. MCCC 1A13316 TaxID=2733487 RepID=UPI0018A4DE67|nr:ABC transporter substrate-binding protein [Halomonas sp. MCCC 1A13316]QOR37945.1 amino acid ABC transporter substrate-binding protein [Halomonas sp. MCCC 1A13316]